MRFITPLIFATLATLVSAQNPFSFNSAPEVTAGSPFPITWSPSTGTVDTVTLVLKKGPATSLTTIMTIISKTYNGGLYVWQVPASLPKGDNYSFQIISDGNSALVNYSIQFTINSEVVPSSTVSGFASGTAILASSTTTSKSAAGRREVELGMGGVVLAGIGAVVVAL